MAKDCNDTRQVVLSKANGEITVFVDWTHDGVSVAPNCAGTVDSIRVVNTGLNTWRCLLPAARRGQGFVDVPPGEDRTYSGNQVRQAGLDELVDVVGIDLVRVG